MSERFSNQIDRFVGKLRGLRERIGARKETKTIREFNEILELARDPGTIELALVRAAGALTGAALVELLDTGQGADGSSTTTRIAGWPAAAMVWSLAEVDALGYPLSLGLWCGEQRRLALQVFEAPSERRKGRLTPRLIRRLTALCAQASAAERALFAKAESPSQRNPEARAVPKRLRRSSRKDPSELLIPFPDLNDFACSGMVHDATYLNAVLPFAIAQANRHQEPLTVLSIETSQSVTRAATAGSDQARVSSKTIAEAIARSLRASDAVALLDDNRIIVVLPNTSPSQAKEVVEITRSAVAPKHPLSPTDASTLFRVGIASFPVDAHDMASLLIAADNAVETLPDTAADSNQNRGHLPHPGGSPHSLSTRPSR